MYQPRLRKSRNRIPIMSNAEIDEHAEELLKDYKSTVLKNPQPVDIEAFAEIYLDLALDYTYLSHCGLILGRMIFQNTERVPVYLPREKCADYLYVDRGTMMIDNTVLEDRKEYRLRSTIGHECGHWIFHSDYYTHTNYQSQGIKPQSGITECRKIDIEGGSGTAGKRRLITDTDWLEHQAKYLSAAILMPKTPFVSVVLDMQENNHHSETDITEALSRIFQVSPASAKIRLVQLGLTGCSNQDVRFANVNYLTCSSI